jgi:hypothetical protein
VLIVWPAIVLPQCCAEPPAPRAKSDTRPAKSLQQQLVHHRAAGEMGPLNFRVLRHHKGADRESGFRWVMFGSEIPKNRVSCNWSYLDQR